MKLALAIRHVHFEDLGIFAPTLEQRGYKVQYLDAHKSDIAAVDPIRPDLLIVLGAPVSVYEENLYPFLLEERNLLEKRLAQKRPTLGICLGAQQIAMTLGAAVEPVGSKEIGFGPVFLTKQGRKSPLRHVEGFPVLHWHGDGFRLPNDAEHLASTPVTPIQAFSIGNNILALQFHLETDLACIEAWLIGHAAELAASQIDPMQIRERAKRYRAALTDAATAAFEEWLDNLD